MYIIIGLVTVNRYLRLKFSNIIRNYYSLDESKPDFLTYSIRSLCNVICLSG